MPREASSGTSRRPWTAGPAFRAAVVVAGGLATLGVFALVDPVTVDSFYAPVERLEVLPAPARTRLAALGLASPEKLLRAIDDGEARARLAAASGLGLD